MTNEDWRAQGKLAAEHGVPAAGWKGLPAEWHEGYTGGIGAALAELSADVDALERVGEEAARAGLPRDANESYSWLRGYDRASPAALYRHPETGVVTNDVDDAAGWWCDGWPVEATADMVTWAPISDEVGFELVRAKVRARRARLEGMARYVAAAAGYVHAYASDGEWTACGVTLAEGVETAADAWDGVSCPACLAVRVVS